MSKPIPLHIPGFVDLQVNGFLGIDFSSEALTEEAFLHAGHALIARGTAAFLPTLITSPEASLHRNLSLIVNALKKDAVLARHVSGFHLEGPFISREPGAVGAHDPASVHAPDTALFDRLYTWSEGRLRLLTLAAELPGAPELARHAVRRGVAVSCGHQLAGPDDLARLAEAGATALTHLGNGMPNLVNRHNNPLLVGLAEERLKILFIADGHHLPAHVLRLLARAAGVDRLIATSDASPAAGLPPGTYDVLGNTAVLEPNGLLHNPEKQCLVGSSATLLRCMNVLHGLGLFALEDLVRIGFHNPLALIGLTPQDVPTCQYALAFSQAEGFVLV
jgi:N-acetylglucosamine-6-phosphate deacetylase